MSFLDKSVPDELVVSIETRKENDVQELFYRHYPHVFYKVCSLNRSFFITLINKIGKCFSSRPEERRSVTFGENYKDQLNLEIDLSRLPTCIGGTNPTPVDQYNNFFDKAFDKSFAEGRLGFV